ncbi:MAG TPA: calcium/proton exchanger [Candidatus Poseidoniaceae archaeon]|mgnify:CR=1 FL=1|nr:MAG TPA: calcium/proton exchanger [Candidatus Poseidoniales archaeon]HII11587.1 calcium/proton exchanger [Candidatus Poseidoniaceae archaeon]|tara:strand:- start:2573 stop:3745 length:1173 start_codon:yes stop_codon:yes gene_type:complete
MGEASAASEEEDTILEEQIEIVFDRLIDAVNPLKNKLNWLLLAFPVALWANAAHHGEMAFIFSMVAIMPLAFLMGKATEEIALRTGETVGGLLNATFGNAVEMIIAGLALYTASQSTNGDTIDTMIHVTQASLIGSILGNLLLVLGLAMVWGGVNHKVQHFNHDSGQMNGSLLLLAIVAFIIPSAVNYAGGDASAIKDLSHYAAIILLVIYGLALLFQLKTHVDVFATEAGHGAHEDPTMSIKDAWILLLLSTAFVGWMAHILVHNLESAVEELGVPELFIGVILLPFFGNAAEHFAAVIVAGKDKMDLAIAIAIGSSVQIALFVAPIMVLLGWALGVPLTLEFGLLETSATFISVLVANSILADGKTNWLEGAMLLGCYIILGAAFFLF